MVLKSIMLKYPVDLHLDLKIVFIVHSVSVVMRGQVLMTQDQKASVIPVSYTHLDVYKRQH